MDDKKKDVEFDADKYYSNSSYGDYSIDEFFKDDISANEDVKQEEPKNSNKFDNILGKFATSVNKIKSSKSNRSKNSNRNVSNSDMKFKVVIVLLLLCIFCVGLYILLSGRTDVIKIS